MINEAILILLACLLGFDLAIGVTWWTLRKANRDSPLVARIKPYLGQRP